MHHPPVGCLLVDKRASPVSQNFRLWAGIANTGKIIMDSLDVPLAGLPQSHMRYRGDMLGLAHHFIAPVRRRVNEQVFRTLQDAGRREVTPGIRFAPGLSTTPNCCREPGDAGKANRVIPPIYASITAQVHRRSLNRYPAVA